MQWAETANNTFLYGFPFIQGKGAENRRFAAGEVQRLDGYGSEESSKLQ
jgi:hypothetical protein